MVSFLFCFLPILSQQSIIESGEYTNFKNALELYNSKAYAAAQKAFLTINTSNYSSSIVSDAAYYEAMCAIKLNQTDAEDKILAFVENNATSSKKNIAFYNVGNFYFENNNASRALKWYQKVAISQLPKDDEKELRFRMAYGLLTAKQYEKAKEGFYSLINDKKYGNDSRYYYGFIAYQLKEYDVAQSTLEEVADNKTYESKISYYLLDINFKSGKFIEAIAQGKELIGKVNRREQSEISKIIGESYFNLKQYEEAIPYLKNYKGKRGKWTNTDYYQLGYAYFKTNNLKAAISYFNKIIGQRNDVAQNAYYHLAQCYLSLDLKNEALNAFKAASEMDFNLKIQEDAALNYAKLSYEEGNPFENSSDVLQRFLEKYPKSTAYEEINELVVSSFLTQQDFTGALEYLKRKKSRQNNILSNEISLYRGLQLFNNNKFKEAISFLVRAQNSSNNEIKNKARYWEAESYFRTNNFSMALNKFLNLDKVASARANFSELKYNIAYSYFNLNDYQNAASYFVKFINQNPENKSILNDANLRLADSYYALASYDKANNYYYKVIENNAKGADYAQYQIGMSNGFLNENYKKIEALTKVVNNYSVSNLKDDALYQLASTYTKVKDNSNAHRSYNRLIQNYPRSIFIPRALLRQGLLYYNQNQNQKALEKFKLTATKYPNSTDAIEAVRNAKNIYIDEDNLDAYVAWTKTLNFVNVSESELERTSFSIAEQKYFEGKNDASITSLEKYLNKYTNTANSLRARYYLADALFATNKLAKATEQYKEVLEAGESEYKEDALSKLSQIYLQSSQFNEALPYLEQLNEFAYEADNILFAKSNLMNVYYETEAYNKAKTFAEQVLANKTINKELELDAQKIIARTSFLEEDYIKAKEYFSILETKATGQLKAETLFYKAYFLHVEKEYEASNKVVQDLIANYSAYKYWGVKSYLIMAKNYYELKDAYQATFILENVIKNFTQFNDLIREAKMVLAEIKTKEAKTNNSITPEKKN